MKKILFLTLALLTILGLTGCNKKQETTSTNTNAVKEQTQEVKEEAKTENKKENINLTDAELEALCGNYVDENSEKCIMTVSKNDNGTLALLISKVVDSNNIEKIMMTGVYNSENKRFDYVDASKDVLIQDDDGVLTDSKKEYENKDGYFIYNDKGLKWHSNVDSETSDIQFVKK